MGIPQVQRFRLVTAIRFITTSARERDANQMDRISWLAFLAQRNQKRSKNSTLAAQIPVMMTSTIT